MPTSKQTGTAVAARLQKARLSYTRLIAENPNYFGTATDYPLKPVMQLQGSTAYERLTCVGFNPDRDLLEATVQILRPAGYNGDLCHAGSTEFVRFYVDYGGGWQDAGLAAFRAHDIPDSRDCAKDPTKPLTYAVTLPYEPTREPCSTPAMPLVRAILSWQHQPPPNSPNWTQVWGNTLDRHVFVKPRRRFFTDVFGPDFELPIDLEWLVEEEIPFPDPPLDLSLTQLAKMYEAGGKSSRATRSKARAQAVEPHRFAAAELEAAFPGGVVDELLVSSKVAAFENIGLDWFEVVGSFEDTTGDVSYEEVDCVGLDNNREWLVANFTIKRPSGYNGTPCRGGSMEYVAFWADYDDSCTWTYVGTAAVKVHDIAAIPPDGLHYWVGVRADVDPFRRPCDQPRISRVRAVLSWNSPPSTTDPDLVPHWGNRLDAHVQVRPGDPLTLDPAIHYLGGVGVSQIDVAGTGRTLPGASFPYWGGAPVEFPHSPFGGTVQVQTTVPASFAAAGHRYRLVTRREGTVATFPVTASFPTSSAGGSPVWRTPDAAGWVDYVPPHQNDADLLGLWHTHHINVLEHSALWEIRLEMESAGGTPLGQTAWHRLQLDNTTPDASISIAAGGDCKDFDQGDTVAGRFVARDADFGRWRLETLPASLGPPNPTSTTPSTSPTSVFGDVWELDTTGMDPCGYVVVVHVWDRAVVHSGPWHNYRRDDVGFCLRTPGT